MLFREHAAGEARNASEMVDHLLGDLDQARRALEVIVDLTSTTTSNITNAQDLSPLLGVITNQLATVIERLDDAWAAVIHEASKMPAGCNREMVKEGG